MNYTYKLYEEFLRKKDECLQFMVHCCFLWPSKTVNIAAFGLNSDQIIVLIKPKHTDKTMGRQLFWGTVKRVRNSKKLKNHGSKSGVSKLRPSSQIRPRRNFINDEQIT